MEVSELGVCAAEMMDDLEASFANYEDVTVGVVAVIAEVNFKDEEGDYATSISYRCNDGRKWIQKGFFAAAQGSVERTRGV